MGDNAATTYTVTSDVIGNPTSDGTWSYTWEKGRQLKQMVKSGTTATFKYNSEGLRVQKTVNGTVTNYTLHGKNIVHMTQGSDSLHFFYDAQNRPAIVEWNNGTTTARYAYIHNLQGDIVGIVDSSGNEAVKYTYDAWGKVLSTTGSLASTLGTVQPFRYRGYVYDVETGLYYLRSRYYRPELCRFVSADELIKGNLFCYCHNNSIIFYDTSGDEAVAIPQSDPTFWFFLYEGLKIVGQGISKGSFAIGVFFTIVLPPSSTANDEEWDESSFYEAVTSHASFFALKAALERAKDKANSYVKNPKYDTNDHHIVAQTANDARRSREILLTNGLSIDADYNKVTVSTKMHMFMHTKIYYKAVEDLLEFSLTLIGTPRRNIITTLSIIKGLISEIDDLIGE